MIALVAVALALLALPGVVEGLGRRLAPSEWARLCIAALAGGALLLELALVLRAAPAVLRALGVPALASACERLLGPLTVGGAPVGWVAGLGAAAIATTAAVIWGGQRGMRRRVLSELWLGVEQEVAGHNVVVIPVPQPLALSLDGQAAVIVLSDGLLASLEPAQIAAVVRHEAAHLAHHHQRLVSIGGVVSGALGWLPLVRSSTVALGLAVERWADEDATAGSQTGRFAVRDALLRLTGADPGPGVAGFSTATTVAARIAALDEPPAPAGLVRHCALYLPGTLAALAAVPVLVSWLDRVQIVFAMAGRCSA